MRRTLSSSEAAFCLKITKKTLDAHRRLGKIFATRNGVSGWWRYPISEVERYSKVLDGISQGQEAVK